MTRAISTGYSRTPLSKKLGIAGPIHWWIHVRPGRQAADGGLPVIARLDSRLLDAATLTLTRAFHDDPMFQWIFPDPVERSRALGHLNRVPLAYGLSQGHATQSDEARAVAVWLPPGRSATTVGMIRAGLLGVPFRVGFRPFGKFMAAMGVMEKIHRQYASAPHWYLLVVAVDRDLRGQGRGAALVSEGLVRADRHGVPCYLETSNQRNLRFYERVGFRVVESARLGDGGPEAWAMVRAAATPQV